MSNYNTFTMSHTNDITTAHGASIETPATPVVVDTAKGPAVDEQPSDERPSDDTDAAVNQGLHLLEAKPTRWYSYFLTPDFWIVLAIGQVLALCITSTNTFTSLLAGEGTNIPAFQTMFNYVLLAVVYTTVFLVQDGPRAWVRVARQDGWKYIIMAFLDVEGNYFTVLAYNYTNILSAQLINFWAIVVVVVCSFLLLKVRYRLFQIVGIVICIGGMGILIGSDHLSGGNGGPGRNLVKGDMFALAGATCYGLSNTFEEWLVSRAPMYQVLSFIGLLGIVINGITAAIFDRDAFEGATWNGDVAGYLVGYTLCLFLFYSLVPLVLRMSSAGFYNISLLTANFWGVIIGIKVFGLKVHFMYPIAFVCIILGLVTYFLSGSMLGESKKPWLGENQERGVLGIGTAKLKALKAAKKAGADPETRFA